MGPAFACENLPSRAAATVIACGFAVTIGAALAADPPVPVASPLRVPSPQSIPEGALGDAVRHGLSLVNATQVAARTYVGNGLNCASCHLNGGAVAYAAPLAGLWGVFPEYVARSGRVETLADRINDCFVRSMNGRPLPLGSDEMRALLAYTAWLSTGVPTGSSVEGRGFAELGAPPHPPDPARGKSVYASNARRVTAPTVEA
jgi:thiosulfate dehydrogenase